MHEPPAPTLAVGILTQNQAHRIRPLLEQANTIANEVLLVDGGSTDTTAVLAAQFPKVRMIHRPFDGNFAAQRNFAIDAAKSDWILFLDTDELLGPNAVRILPALLRTEVHGVKFPRYWISPTKPTHYIESEIHYPDRQLRLLRRLPQIRFDENRPVHETIPKEARGPVLRLRRSHILHYCFQWESLEDRRKKVARYEARRQAWRTNRMYLFEEMEHRHYPLREDWRNGQPWVASMLDYWRDLARLYLPDLRRHDG